MVLEARRCKFIESLADNKLEKQMFYNSKAIVDAADSGDYKTLARSLLIASGISSKDGVDGYMGALEDIREDFKRKRDPLYEEFCDIGKAETLHDYLWDGYGKEKERGESGQINFATAVYRQSEGLMGVGNCAGLTVLYGVLAMAEGIDFYLSSSDDVIQTNDGIMRDISHVMGRVVCENAGDVDVECTSPVGFGHSPSQKFSISNPSDLISNLYSNRAGLDLLVGDYEDGAKNFMKALLFTPDHFYSRLGLGLCIASSGNYEAGFKWVGRAFKKNGESSIGYGTRAWIHEMMGNYEAAEADLIKAVDINPMYKWAVQELEIVKELNAAGDVVVSDSAPDGFTMGKKQ